MRINNVRTAWFSLICAGLLSTPSVTAVAQPSYPKVLTTGNGLGISRVNVTMKNGSSWTAAGSMLQTGGRYRVAIRITNFYPPRSGNIFLGGYTDTITSIYFSVDINGMPVPPSMEAGEWFTTSTFSGAGQKSYAHTDNQSLGQGQSRTYYAYLKWIGIPTPLTRIDLSLAGSEQRALDRRDATVAPTP